LAAEKFQITLCVHQPGENIAMNAHAIASLAALVVAGLTFAFMLKKQREIDCPS